MYVYETLHMNSMWYKVILPGVNWFELWGLMYCYCNGKITKCVTYDKKVLF